MSKDNIIHRLSYFLYSISDILGFPGGSEVKASASNAGDRGSIPGSGRSPGEGNSNPLQYSCLENPMDRERSLAGYSPWGRKESDTTEQLHFTSLQIFCEISNRQTNKVATEKQQGLKLTQII